MTYDALFTSNSIYGGNEIPTNTWFNVCNKNYITHEESFELTEKSVKHWLFEGNLFLN